MKRKKIAASRLPAVLNHVSRLAGRKQWEEACSLAVSVLTDHPGLIRTDLRMAKSAGHDCISISSPKVPGVMVGFPGPMARRYGLIAQIDGRYRRVINQYHRWL